MQELDILKWAAGSVNPIPEIYALDVNSLLEATSYHRLAGRLLRRLRREPQRWANRALTAELTAMQSQIEYDVQEQIEATREINAAYTSSNQSLITIKGFSSYALTGDPDMVRWSNDIDVLCSDPTILIDTLLRLGYKHDRLAATAHQFADMGRGGLSIDAHNYFPVYGFPSQMSSSDFVPEQNPGVWNQTVSPQPFQVQYSDIVEHSTFGVLPEISTLALPDPTMAVFLVCAHAFRNPFVGLPTKDGMVILAELAEVGELARHPGFQEKSFLEIIERFGGYDSVSFVGALVEEYFGFNPFPYLRANMASERRFIRYWSTFWLPITWSAGDLLIDDPSSMRNLVSTLGANTVVAGTSGTEPVYSALVPGAGNAVGRVITVCPEGRRLPIEFSVRCENKRLIFDVSVLGRPGADYERVRVDLGEIYCTWTFKNSEKISWTKGNCAATNVSFNETGYNLQVELPWDPPENLSQQLPIPALLAATQEGAGRETEVKSGTLIPLNIVR